MILMAVTAIVFRVFGRSLSIMFLDRKRPVLRKNKCDQMLKIKLANLAKRCTKSDCKSFYLLTGVLQNKPNNSLNFSATF